MIDKLAHKLLEVETIDLTQIAEVLGERPFKPNKQYEEYLNEKKKMMEEVRKDKSNPDNTGEGGAKQDPIAAMTSKFKNIKRTDYLLWFFWLLIMICNIIVDLVNNKVLISIF